MDFVSVQVVTLDDRKMMVIPAALRNYFDNRPFDNRRNTVLFNLINPEEGQEIVFGGGNEPLVVPLIESRRIVNRLDARRK